jgi:hypothetical protein
MPVASKALATWFLMFQVRLTRKIIRLRCGYGLQAWIIDPILWVMLHLRAVFLQICPTDRVGKQACIRVSIFRNNCSRLSKFIRQHLVCSICPQKQSVDVGLLLLYPSYRDLDYGSENTVKYTARSRCFQTYSSFTITRYTTFTTKHSTNNIVISFTLWEWDTCWGRKGRSGQ